MKQTRLTAFFAATLAALVLAMSAQAQTSIILDGTSGNNTTSTPYSTDGGLNLSLGFFADYLVVAGGGSGGTAGSVSGTGGGGAGGLLQGNTQLSSGNYSVTVGAGGVAPNTSGTTAVQGVNGTDSVFGDLTAVGGGGGGRFNVSGNAGGSGGGGGGRNSTVGGAGTTNDLTIQGFAGGTARGGNDSGRSGGGGGGGAGSVGGNGAPASSTAGNGGAGLANSITGSAVFYSGGGGGGARDTNSGASQTAGTGGAGGGGAGSTSGSASNGTNGLGGGGGGAGDLGRGGNGGSGAVIVRYLGASLGNIGGTVTSGTGSAAGHTIHTFSSTGNSSLDLSGVDMSTRLGTTLRGVLSGTGGMTYNGPGTLRLIASNTFTGETRIANGTLALASSYALWYSTLNMASSDSGALSFEPGVPGNFTYLLGGLTGSRDIAMGGHTLRIGENNGNTTYSGNISGSGGLTKAGTGTLTLSGNNTYSDQTHVSTGTLATTGANRLGTSKILNISNTATLRLGGNETFQQINGYGNIIVGNNAFLTYHPTAPANHLGFIANSISGEGGFIKDGASSVNLIRYAAGRNVTYTYTGDTIVNAGTLWTQMENQLPTGNTVIVNSGATLGLIGNQTLGVVTGSGTVDIGHYNLTIGATSGTFSGSLVGSAKLIKNGAGTLTLSGNSSGSFTGDADITGGTLVLNSANALSTDAVITMSADTTLTVNQRTFVGALDQGGGAVNGPGELVATLTSTSSGSLNAVIADGVDFSAGILKRTGGTTTVGAANTFTGAVKVQDGTLQLTGSGSFSSASSLVTSTGATMDLNNKSQTFSKVSGLGGTVALGNGTLTVNQASDTEYGGSITGSGGFVKSGAGNFTLSGASTYLGATTVSAGQLIVDGSLSSATTVESGASLSGSGSVGAISGSGSINPGNSPGILTAPSIDASGGLSFNFEFTSLSPVYSDATASSNDVLRLTGEAPFVSSLTSINAVNLYFNVPTFQNGQIYTGGFFTDQPADFLQQIINATLTSYVADDNGGFNYKGQNYRLLDGLSVSLSTTSQTADFAGGTVSDGRVLQVQVVPEPSSYMLLVLSAAGLGAHVLRRRRKRDARLASL